MLKTTALILLIVALIGCSSDSQRPAPSFDVQLDPYTPDVRAEGFVRPWYWEEIISYQSKQRVRLLSDDDLTVNYVVFVQAYGIKTTVIQVAGWVDTQGNWATGQ